MFSRSPLAPSPHRYPTVRANGLISAWQFMANPRNEGLGDVMYHLGTQGRLDYSGPDLPRGVSQDALAFLEEAGLGARDYSLDISLAPNPSHLEAVNPVTIHMLL